MDEELRKLLEGILLKADGGQDAYDKLINAVNTLKSSANTQKTLGVKTKEKLDALQTVFDEVSASLMNVGWDPEDKEAKLDDFLGGLIKNPKKKKKDKQGNVIDDDDFVLEDHPAFKKMQKALKLTQTQLDESNSKVEAAKKKEQNNIISKALTKGFQNDKGEFTHYGVESRVENMVLTGKLGVNEENKPFWKDSADENNEIEFETGLKSYLDSDDVKRDLRSTQQGGGGSPAGGGGGGGKPSDAERISHINKNAGAFSFVK